MATRQVPERADVARERTWDLESIFADDQAWESAFRDVEQRLGSLRASAGRLSEPAAIAGFLEQRDALVHDFMHVLVYAGLGHATDASDEAAGAREQRSWALYARLGEAIAFAEPELLALGADRLRALPGEHERLRVYAFELQRLLDRAEHLRSAEVEDLLAAVTEPFQTASATSEFLTDSDLEFRPARSEDGGEAEVTQGSWEGYLLEGDRTLRQTTWESYADGYLSVKATLANGLAATVKQNVFLARARRYPSTLEMALAPERLTPAVYRTVTETFRANLGIWHRYWRLRREWLGLDVLRVADLKAPLGDAKLVVPYEEAIELVSEAVAPLGEDYVQALRRGVLEQRWVDVYPTRGKRPGAFSAGSAGTHPFVCMNYTDDLESASVLAHELGHSLHSWHTWRTQPLPYADYSTFVAEVASNFNQALMRAHLFATRGDDRELTLAVIDEAMSNFHRYFFIMPTLARFELELYERVERGEALTAGTMIGLMSDLFEEGYGGEVEIDRDRIGITWAQFPHLFSRFYVFQYTTGISGAHALADGVLAGTPGAAERYVEFLSAGSSLYPLDALRRAGVDLASPAPVEQTFGVLNGLVDRLESLAR